MDQGGLIRKVGLIGALMGGAIASPLLQRLQTPPTDHGGYFHRLTSRRHGRGVLTPEQRGRYAAYRLGGAPPQLNPKSAIHVRTRDGTHHWYPLEQIEIARLRAESSGGILELLNRRGQVVTRERF